MGSYSSQIVATGLSCLGSSNNRGRGSFDDLRRLICLLLGSLDRARGGIGSGILKGSNRGRLLNLWRSLVNLGGVGDVLGFRLEKTRRREQTNDD